MNGSAQRRLHDRLGNPSRMVTFVATTAEPRQKRQVPPAWLEHLGVIVLFSLLTAVMTWPLVAIMNRGVLGPPGDNLEYVWKMWWFKRALLDLRTTPFFNPDVFYPFGYPLALSEMTMANTVLMLPVTLLLGETVAYNLAIYGSFVLSGYGMYLLLRGLRCGQIAALFGGVAFAYCPYRMSHMGAGHLPLMGTGWIPLLFWAIERMLQSPSWRRGWPVGLFYALAAHSSWYYALMVAPFAAIFLLLRHRFMQRDGSGDGENASTHTRGFWLGLGAAAVVAVVLLAPALGQVLPQFQRGEMGYDQSLAYLDQWSASPVDFVYPNAMHSLWGAPLTTAYYQNINENLVYLGWVPMLLALVGLYRSIKDRTAGPHALRVYALLGGLAFVLALGMTLHYAGDTVYLRVPSEIEHAFSRGLYLLTGKLALNRVAYGSMQRELAIPLPMPTLLLYLYVPFMSAMRVWSRFGVLVIQAVAVLSAWGLDSLLRNRTPESAKPARGQMWVGAVAILLLLVDFAVLPYPYGYTEARGQPVDTWLAGQPGAEAIIHYPLEKTWYGWMIYPQRVHGRPMAYGYGTFAPAAYEQAVQGLAEWPSQEALSQLEDWGVRYVLLGARAYGDDWPAVEGETSTLQGLEKVGVFEDLPLFRDDRLLHLVRPRADVPSTELIAGPRRSYLQDEIHVYEIR